MRIYVSFGNGDDEIIYSIRERRPYSYERNREELHRLYGGRQYYSSRSGLSGAGFLEPSPANNDLVIFGTYRTDTAAVMQRREIVHLENEKPIFGYAPIKSHDGVDEAAPFVLTDGKKVAFVSPYRVPDVLKDWKKIDGKEKQLIWYDLEGSAHILRFSIFNVEHWRGVRGLRATRFLDLREARKYQRNLRPRHESLFERKLRIAQYKELWFHIAPDGYIDKVWRESPRDLKGEIVGGWQGEGEGLFWRRRDLKVEAFMEVPLDSLNSGKIEGPEFIGYEEMLDVYTWFGTTVDKWKKYFKEKAEEEWNEWKIYC